MATFDGGDMLLLMLLGVTVVIITLRAMARADRIKQEAWAEQVGVSVRRSTDGGAPPRWAASRSAASYDISGSDRAKADAEPAREWSAADVRGGTIRHRQALRH